MENVSLFWKSRIKKSDIWLKNIDVKLDLKFSTEKISSKNWNSIFDIKLKISFERAIL